MSTTPTNSAQTAVDLSALIEAPLRLSRSARLDVSQSTIFELVSNPALAPQLFPWIQSVTVEPASTETADQLGRCHRCNFGQGLILKETVVGWEPPQLYAYACSAANPLGLHNHLGLVTCVAAEVQQTTLTWQHYFDHPNPEAMQEKMAGSLTLAFQTLIHRFGGRLLESYINFK